MPDVTKSEILDILVRIRESGDKAVKDLNDALNQTYKSSTTASSGMSKFTTNVEKTKKSLFNLRNLILGLVTAFGAWKLTSFIKDSTLLAARFRTLGVTLRELSLRAGYSTAQINKFEEGLHKTGIAAVETRAILTRMIQSELDLSKAHDLARVAQNAAVIANLNSSETFERLLHAIQANSVEILRTIGLNVSFERSYKKFADTLNIGANQLTEAQKTQARFNAVLDGGVQIAGAYEAAMTTAGKQLLSFARYTANFRVEFGKAFEPALAEVVKSATEAMKEFTEVIKDNKFRGDLQQFGQIIGDQIKSGFQWLINNKDSILQATLTIAKGIGLAINGVNAVLRVFEENQKVVVQQLRGNLTTAVNQLEFYEEKVAAIKEKLEKGGGFFTSPVGTQSKLKKDLEKDLKVIEFYKGEIVKYKKALELAIQKPIVEFTSTAFGRAAGVFQKLYYFKKKIEERKTPLTTSVYASNLKRSLSDIELALAKLSSAYDDNLISVGKYYDEKIALSKKAFEAEKKYITGEISRETDPDKKLKLEDQLYLKRKKNEEDLIKLESEKLKAGDEAIKTRDSINQRIAAARINIEKKSSIDMSETFRLEQEELKNRQAQEIQDLKNQKASLDQIEETHRIHQLERDQQVADQRKQVTEKTNEGIALSLNNLNNAFGDLYEASGQKIKEFFYLQKAISIAQTIISTYESAQKAYNSLVGIPYVGPALGAVAAATAVAAGLARVAAIRSQNYGEGGLIGGYSPTSTSDNIPINATAKEYMHKRAAVKKYGLPFMESVNNLTFPVELARSIVAARNIRYPRTDSYAQGGLITRNNNLGQITNSISVTVNGPVDNPTGVGREIGRSLKVEIIKSIREQMRPGGLLYTSR